MQSFSLAGSAFQVASGAFPLSLTTPLSIFSCSPGNSIRSKTLTGHTVMQIPSAMQMSKSTPTADPWTPYSLLTPLFHFTWWSMCFSLFGHPFGKLGSSISFLTSAIGVASSPQRRGLAYKIVEYRLYTNTPQGLSDPRSIRTIDASSRIRDHRTMLQSPALLRSGVDGCTYRFSLPEQGPRF